MTETTANPEGHAPRATRHAPDVARLAGTFRVESYCARSGRLLGVQQARNIVTTPGKTAFLHLAATDGAAIAGIQYLAVGTGSGAPALTDVRLYNEIARQPLSQSIVAGNSLSVQAFFTSTQGNGTWTEVGAAGNGATDAADTGTLFARALLSYTKTTSLETILAYTIMLS